MLKAIVIAFVSVLAVSAKVSAQAPAAVKGVTPVAKAAAVKTVAPAVQAVPSAVNAQSNATALKNLSTLKKVVDKPSGNVPALKTNAAAPPNNY